MMQGIHDRTGMSIAKSVVAYAVLPDIWSRVVGCIPRFGMIAYFMAIIFQTIKLLPERHPFFEPSRMGTYRVRDVLAAAANNLHGGFKNADHYIVFGVFLIGMVLLVLQFAFLAAMLIIRPAEAWNVPFSGMFITTYPETDVAHLMLDRMFGIPGFFQSCVDPVINAASPKNCAGYLASPMFPTAFQRGMQTLFNFYSLGMLAVAGFVVVYYLFALTLETVNTGIPFGKRFQSIYSPIRLVMAVLLMLPLAYGYNTGQYMVLHAAKWGSALATNAWWIFNQRVGDNPMGMENHQLVGVPKVQNIEGIINFFYVAQTCRAAHVLAFGQDIEPYLVRSATPGKSAEAYSLAGGTSFDEARDFYAGGNVQIVFGSQRAEYVGYPAAVKPLCGVITIPTLAQDIQGISSIYNVYFKNIQDIWNNQDMDAYGWRMACNLKFKNKCGTLPSTSVDWDAEDKNPAGQGFYITMRQNFQANFNAQMQEEIATLRNTTNPALAMDGRIMLSGWGGAGMWFNKVAGFNGAFVDAMSNIPTPTQYPMVMEHVAKKKKGAETKIARRDRFSLTTASGEKVAGLDKQIDDAGLGDPMLNLTIASVLNTVYQAVEDTSSQSQAKADGTKNPLKDMISALFGQTGLFDFRANSEVFPLAKLSVLGREIMNKTVLMIAASTVMSSLSGVVGTDLGPLDDIMAHVGPGVKSFAVIGITVGVLLYYVVPMMPFIYFFFAVGRWVKSIFEAMVAIPLWALAHMRLGGDGIPGPAAGQGYFLILEIFLRPILTLFGLLASVACFMAISAGLDSVFNLAVLNAGGFDMTTLSSPDSVGLMDAVRDGVDALFYTVLYAILVYMIATSSFKLIDLFPNAIMRWGGTNTAGFNDSTDPIGQLEYNLVYRVDTTAREITKAGSTFDDVRRLREKG